MASFLDPLNIALSFVPVVGEARIMSLMGKASGIGQRALIRGGIGAASGAVGAAMLEPMVYLSQQDLQADYTLANSLMNLGFGAILGGTLHAAGGTIRERWRAKRNLPQAWEYVPPDWQSEELMRQHTEDMYAAMARVWPDESEAKIREVAETEATLFDARARNWAYHEKKTVKEFYDQWRPRYLISWTDGVPSEMRGTGGGDLSWIGRPYEGLRSLDADVMTMPEFLENLALWEERFPDLHDYEGIRENIEKARRGQFSLGEEETLNHAMYRSDATNVREFIEKTRGNNYSDKQFFHFREVTRDGQTLPVELGFDQVKHIDRRHPDF